MRAASPGNDNSKPWIGRRMVVWLTLLAAGLSGAGSALAICCSQGAINSSCCIPASQHQPSQLSARDHAQAGMRSMGCYESANQRIAEVSSAACSMAWGAGPFESVEAGDVANQRALLAFSGPSFVSATDPEDALVPTTVARVSILPATRQRLPLGPSIPLRI